MSDYGLDIGFAVYLPIGANWSAFPFQVPMFEWDGVQYPQGDPECSFGPNFKLIKRPPFQPDRLFELPLEHRSATWQPIFITGPGLYIYWSGLDGYMEEDATGSLEKLLYHLLTDQPKWVVVYMPGFDQLDEVIPGDVNTVLERVKYSLTVKTTGYVVWGGKGN